MLCEMFPDAKFIHIHRNPYDVFISMQNFYQKLLKELALQGYSHVDIDEEIFLAYDRMMRTYECDVENIPSERLIELRYDDLDVNPMQAVEKIYSALALPGFSQGRDRFEQYLASVRGFKKNVFEYSDKTAAKVEGRLGYFIDKWGYDRP